MRSASKRPRPAWLAAAALAIGAAGSTTMVSVGVPIVPVGAVQAGVAPGSGGAGRVDLPIAAIVATTAATSALLGLAGWSLRRRKRAARYLRRSSAPPFRAASIVLVVLWSVALGALALLMMDSPVRHAPARSGRPPQSHAMARPVARSSPRSWPAGADSGSRPGRESMTAIMTI